MDPQNQLITFLEDLKQKEINDDTFYWLEEHIQENEQSKIHALIYSIGDHFNEEQYIKLAFEGLIKIFELNPQVLITQMMQNKMMPKIVINYLAQIDIKYWDQNLLKLLQHTFEGNSYHHQLIQLQQQQQLQFIQNILNYLINVDDEQLFSVFVQLIVEFYDNQIIIKYCLEHQNIRFFQEYLLEYINKTQNDISKSLFFIETILKNDKDFFYINDFKVLQQISIRQINDGNEYTRQLFLRNLNVLIYYGDFQNILVDEILESVHMVQMSYNDEYSLKKCIQIINNITTKQKT